MDISRLMRSFGRTLIDNSPAILTSMAVAGTVSTAVLAAKGGMKAKDILDDLEEEYQAERVDDDQMTLTNKAKLTWKYYIPAGCMAGATVACIIGANSVSTRRNAAIMSAYSLTDKAFQEYKEKVVEQLGEKKEKAVRDEIAKSHIERDPIESKEVIVVGQGDNLCYDGVTGRYFMSDIESIRRAVNDINQKCINEVYASQNDFYREIGLAPTALGEELGWRSDHLLEVSFSSHLSGDGKPCLSLDYLVGPIRGYYRGH